MLVTSTANGYSIDVNFILKDQDTLLKLYVATKDNTTKENGSSTINMNTVYSQSMHN